MSSLLRKIIIYLSETTLERCFELAGITDNIYPCLHKAMELNSLLLNYAGRIEGLFSWPEKDSAMEFDALAFVVRVGITKTSSSEELVHLASLIMQYYFLEAISVHERFLEEKEGR